MLLGTAGLVVAMLPAGPDRLGELSAVVIATAYAAGLAARTGGRPFVFGGLALSLGVVVLVTGDPTLRTGAAVMTCVVTAVLAVMITVPARRFVVAARECVLAVLVASVGALATVGLEPVITVVRFEYTVLVLALAGAFAVVYRLGAGLHGLGRRGVAGVLAGGVLLAVILLYAELLRRYGANGLVESLLDGVGWVRAHARAFPRPLVSVLGIPALAWGAHMRARRRQGWWLCAFGVAATAPVANTLVNPGVSVLEGGLSVGYGLVIGLMVGYLLIRVDLALTGSRGRRARRAEQESAARPEPRRTEPLF